MPAKIETAQSKATNGQETNPSLAAVNAYSKEQGSQSTPSQKNDSNVTPTKRPERRQVKVLLSAENIVDSQKESQDLGRQRAAELYNNSRTSTEDAIRNQAVQDLVTGKVTIEEVKSYTQDANFAKGNVEAFLQNEMQFIQDKSNCSSGCQKGCCSAQKGVEVKTKEGLQSENKLEAPKVETVGAKENIEQKKEVVVAVEQKVTEPQLKDIPVVIPQEIPIIKIIENISARNETPVSAKEEIKQDNASKIDQKVDESQLRSAQDKEDARAYAERKLKEEEALIAKKNIEAEVIRIKELEAEIKKNTEVQNKVEKELAQFTKALKEELLVKKQAGDASPISAVKVERYQALKMLKMNLDKTLEQQRISIIKAKQSLLKPLPKPVIINSFTSNSTKPEITKPLQSISAIQPVTLRSIPQTRNREVKPVQRVSATVGKYVSVNKPIRQRIQPRIQKNLLIALRASSKLVAIKVNKVVSPTRKVVKKSAPQVIRSIKTSQLKSIRQSSNLKRVANRKQLVRKPIKLVSVKQVANSQVKKNINKLQAVKPVNNLKKSTNKNQVIRKPVSKVVVQSVKRLAKPVVTKRKTAIVKPVQMKKVAGVRQQRSRVQTRVRTANIRKGAQRVSPRKQAVIARKVNTQQRLNKATVRTLSRVRKFTGVQKNNVKLKNSQLLKNINSIRRTKNISQRLQVNKRRQLMIKQRNIVNNKSKQRANVNQNRKIQVKNNSLNQLRRAAVSKRIVKNRIVASTKKVELRFKINKAQQRVVTKNLDSIRNFSKKTIKLTTAKNISKQKVAKPLNAKITKIAQQKTKIPVLALKKKMTRKQVKLLAKANKMKKQEEFDQMLLFDGIKKKKRVFLNKKLKRNIRLEAKNSIIH